MVNYSRRMFNTRTDGAKKETTAPLSIREVRAAFVFRGSSLSGWARKNGYSAELASMAVRGLRSGPLSRRIVAEVKRELGD